MAPSRTPFSEGNGQEVSHLQQTLTLAETSHKLLPTPLNRENGEGKPHTNTHTPPSRSSLGLELPCPLGHPSPSFQMVPVFEEIGAKDPDTAPTAGTSQPHFLEQCDPEAARLLAILPFTAPQPIPHKAPCSGQHLSSRPEQATLPSQDACSSLFLASSAKSSAEAHQDCLLVPGGAGQMQSGEETWVPRKKECKTP